MMFPLYIRTIETESKAIGHDRLHKHHADPGPAHPALLGDDIYISRELASPEDDGCGTIQKVDSEHARETSS
jgi:hypothetical protein